MNDDYKDIWRIRKSLPDSFDYFYEQIMNLAVGVMRLRADKLCAPYKMRVGVFGPYTGNGKKIILEIAKKVSSCGYGAITGFGFFPQNQPGKLHSLNELVPPATAKALRTFDVPEYIRFRHFPKLVCKAIHHLSVVRGQRNEAEGCFSVGIPMMGFILDRRALKKRKHCPYLVHYAVYHECMCPNYKLCFYTRVKTHCPFYDYVNIPWAVKQLFINENNRAVATNNLQNMLYVVEECLKAKPFKRKIRYDL